MSDAICEDTQLFSLSRPDEQVIGSSGRIFLHPAIDISLPPPFLRGKSAWAFSRNSISRSASFACYKSSSKCQGLPAVVLSRCISSFNPNRSLDFGEIARLCHAACFWPNRRRSGLRRGVARSRMRTEAGKMPGSLIFPIRNGHGVSNDRFGFKRWRRIRSGQSC